MIFAASTAATIIGCVSMSSMHEMAMPGGWTMSMAWMRMPGQTWVGASTSFVSMWIAMMVAMMLPVLVPMLRRYRNAACYTGMRGSNGWAALVAAGYFLAWTLLGIAIFPIGSAFATLAMKSPALARGVPIATGVIVLFAGALQLSGWKAHLLTCCRGATACGSTLRTDAVTAWRLGLRLGLRCIGCCAPLTAILLALGVMDPDAMAIVTVAIIAERLAPNGARVARSIGWVAVATGAVLIVRAVAPLA
ncbi:MAG: DUF2182 domain-containing protein [Rhodanobacteraceae bacterium]